MADQYVNTGAAYGDMSLSSPGSGHPRGVNEAGVSIPTGFEGQGNGVSMPGPMRSGFEEGFYPVGGSMEGVSDYQGYISGVQLNGGPNEEGWIYGADMNGLAPHQAEPPTNQQFGIESGDLAGWDGDDALFGSIAGRRGSNTDGVQPGDILSVFNQVADHNSGSGSGVSGGGAGYDSMRGIVLGPGSGPYTGGEQRTDSVGQGSSSVEPSEY